MQKKQIFQLVLLAVGAVLAAVIGFWLVPVSNYIKARTAPLDETILEAESSTREVVTISDTELSRLISGELTLDALADLPGRHHRGARRHHGRCRPGRWRGQSLPCGRDFRFCHCRERSCFGRCFP